MPITITPTTLPTATIGQSYSAQLSASGGTGPYTWLVVSVPLGGEVLGGEGIALPPGLSMSTAGLITGTPLSRMIGTFRVRVTDSVGAYTLSDPYTLPIGLSLGYAHVVRAGKGLGA